MSFDLFFFESPRATSRKEAEVLYKTACEEEEIEDPEPTPKIRRFAEDVLRKYPALEDLPEADLDHSPWSVSPSPIAGFMPVCISFSMADKVAAELLTIASKHGLLCYDPQEEKVHLPPGMKPLSTYEGPTRREVFQEVCQNIGRLLKPDGFKSAKDSYLPFLERTHEDWNETIGLTHAGEDGVELRMTWSILSEAFLKWRQTQKSKHPQLPLGSSAEIAAVDFRRLAPQHPLFNRNLVHPEDRDLGAGQAVELVRSAGFPYSDLFRNPVRLSAYLEEKELPGLKTAEAIEFFLFRNRHDLAVKVLRVLVKRLPDPGSVTPDNVDLVRGGGALSASVTRNAAILIKAVAFYDLVL